MTGKLWKAYTMQLLLSPRFWMSVLCIAGISSIRLFYASSTIKDTVYAYQLLFFWDAFRKLIPLFAAFPFAPQFAREWNSGYFTFIIGRCGAKPYARTQAAICAVTSFLVCFLGLLLFIGFASLVKPFYIHDPVRVVPPYGYFLEHGMPLVFMLFMAFIFSLSCAMWSMCGLVISSLFPNVYVALCAPFICSYLLEHLTDSCPPYFSFFTMAIGLNVLEGASPVVNFLYNTGFFLCWIVLLGLVYRIIIGKRVRNELH